jgi:hypothetical protein
MGAQHSKVQALVLNAQGGKTRRIQDLIREDDVANPGGYFNFVIQANNRTLVAQTGARMSTELYAGGGGEEADEAGPADDRIEGSVFSWFSGAGPRITPEVLAGKMIVGGVNMVICCAHARRLEYLLQLVTKMESTLGRLRSPTKLRIWWDEADASVNFLSDMRYQEMMQKPIVDKVTLVTATVYALIKKFKTLRIVPVERPTLPIYFRVQDYEVSLLDLRASAADFFKCVVESNLERYFTPGTCTFAPAAVKKNSHEAIAAIAAAHGAVVVMINGTHKEIRVPGEKPIPLPVLKADVECEEIGRAIGRIYQEKKLARFPLFVTGHMCLGRGITFQNEMFLFDHQILPPDFDDEAEAYQAAGRGAGNIRALPNFVARAATGFRPTLVTTPLTWRLTVEAENAASRLGPSVCGRESNVVNADDLALAAKPRNLLQFSRVPVRFPLPAPLLDIHKRTGSVAVWREEVLAALATLAPELHTEIAPFAKAHVNNYSIADSVLRHKGMFRPVYEAARQGLRARVPTFEGVEGPRENVWYAALDHSNGHLVVCVWEGGKIPADWVV